MLSKHAASIFALLIAAPFSMLAQPAFAAAPTSTSSDADAPTKPKVHALIKKSVEKSENGKHDKRRRGHAHAKHEHEVLREVEHGREPSVTPKIEIKKHSKHEKMIDSSKADVDPPAAATVVAIDPPMAAPEKKSEAKLRRGKHAPKGPCLHEAVDILRGSEQGTFSLTKCDGSIAPLAVEQLSILARPSNAMRPAAPIGSLSKIKGAEIAPGIKRMDPLLAVRLQSLVDHFAKTGTPSRLFLVSGYRPNAAGSFHASGKALDFRIDGVKNEELVSFCKTLPDTGCGFYPNSSFVHIDVRNAGTGHVTWIDASGPGETPRYVGQWPPPEAKEMKDDEVKIERDTDSILSKLDKELPALPADDHPSEPQSKERIARDPSTKATEPTTEVAKRTTKGSDAIVPPADIVDDQTP